jgi:hypothetical protein
MSETFNDYICRVKTFSTFILPPGASTSLDLLTPLRLPRQNSLAAASSPRGISRVANLRALDDSMLLENPPGQRKLSANPPTGDTQGSQQVGAPFIPARIT